MVELFVVVGGLVAIALIRRRFDALETRIASLEARLADAAAPALARVPEPGADTAPVPPPLADAAERPAPPPPLPPVPPVPPVPLPAPAAAGLGSSRGLEEALATRWAVWVGGVALALGGVFLVRYSIEQGLVGPGMRVALGLAFAALLIGAGEWLRRRERPVELAAFSNANIPAILTAAGTSTAFASVYAAYGLYGLIGPGAAFVALGAVSLVTMAASAVHGPALAGLGLVAALASPLLVETSDPNPVVLVTYLAFAVGSAYAVARLRLWRWLAISAAAGAWLWGMVILTLGSGWVGAAIIHVVAQLTLAILFVIADVYRGLDDHDDTRLDVVVAVVLTAFALLTVVTADELGAGYGRLAFVGLVAAMMAGAAWRYPAAASGLAAAAVATVGTLLVWPVASEAAREPLAIVPDLASAPYPEALTTFVTTAALLAGLVLLAGFGRVLAGGSLRPGLAAWYLGAATLGPLAALVVAYWRITFFDRSIPFALLAAALGLAFAGLAGALRRKLGDTATGQLAVGVAASAAVGALAAGLTFAFDRGVLTVALALSALGTAAISEKAAVPALRYVVGALGLAVAARLAWDPTVMRGEIGETPVLNWLLWGYGVPALSFWLAAQVMARRGRDQIVRLAEGLAIVFSALLVFLQIRHALHSGRPFAPRTDHLEAGLVVTEFLGFTLLLTRLDFVRPDPLYRFASLAFATLSLAGAAVVLGVWSNPYLSGEPILGGPFVNSLLPAYLVPAAMALAIAISSRVNRPRPFVLAAAALALALELAYSFLEVRFLFQGPRIDALRPTSEAELWCYSLILIAHGIGLLALGVLRDSQAARLASAACIVAAVVKVFLIDLSALEGLTRALSFVGLGLALVAIGFVYQRILSARAGTAV